MGNNELLKAISEMMDSKLEPIKLEITAIKSTQEVHTQLLRALEDVTSNNLQ